MLGVNLSEIGFLVEDALLMLERALLTLTLFCISIRKGRGMEWTTILSFSCLSGVIYVFIMKSLKKSLNGVI